MFKLIKILHSGVNVPEPCRLPVTSGVSYKIGAALTLSSGKAVNCTAKVKPTYIAAETRASGTGSTVLAYPVNGDMLFETTFSATPTGIVPGSLVTLNVDTASSATNVTATTTDGVATVVDTMGAAAAGDKVIVKF